MCLIDGGPAPATSATYGQELSVRKFRCPNRKSAGHAGAATSTRRNEPKQMEKSSCFHIFVSAGDLSSDHLPNRLGEMVGELRRSLMTRRRITRTLGAAIGGLLGAAYLPAAFAFADDIVITPDPSSTELVSGFYGLSNVNTPPAVPDTVQGEQLFDYTDKTTDQTGTFYGYESIDQGARSENLYYVAPDQTPAGEPAATNPLPSGSVITIEDNGPNNETIYSDLTSSSGKDVDTQTHVTAFGDHTYAERFDPSAYLTDKYLDQSFPYTDSDITLTDGYTVVPVDSDASITSINGLGDLDIVGQEGPQEFELVGPNGPVGYFDAIQTNTADAFGNYSEELFVTQDISGTPGSAVGDIPPVDSVFNFFSRADGESSSLYSALPSTDGGKDDVTFALYRDGTERTADPHVYSFDATSADNLTKFEVPSEDYTITPATSQIEHISGVDGLPPYDMSDQGYEQLDIYNASDQQIGVVDADVSTAATSHGQFSEAFLVTDVESGTGGTGTGDVPPVGSVFDVVSHGGDKYTVYSDIPQSNGTDVIKEYSVNTKTGAEHLMHTKLDLAAGLTHDQFIDPFTSTGVSSGPDASVDPSALTSSLDTSALTSSLDPSAAISPDSVTDSLLHSGALLDPFPHIEAALQVLTGLF
jgi:hypothetical protein